MHADIKTRLTFRLGSLKGKQHSEDIGLNGRIILKYVNRFGGCDWNHPVWDR